MTSSRSPEEDIPPKSVRIACNTCRKTKLRCSRERPACANCRRGGHECFYESKRHKPGIRAGAIESIYRRLDALERTVFEPPSQLQRQKPLPVDDGENDAEEMASETGTPSPSGSHIRQAEQFNRHLDGDGSRNEDDDRPLLPPFKFIETIVTIYFSHIHPWIPMLNQDRFRSRSQFPDELQKLEIILHAMSIAVCRYVIPNEGDERNSGPHSVSYTGWSPASLRRWVVSTAMDNLSIEGLQALIIIAFDDIGSGNAFKAWSIIASLTRTVEYCQLTMEQDLGDRRPICRPFSYLSPPKDWTDQEERRRVFWNVFILDRFCSISMGWNISLTSIDVRQRLPSDGILWRKQEAVVTPYLGVWDKSTGRVGSNPAVSAAVAPQSPSDVSCDSARTSEIDMSKVGQFAYCVEATESMSRVTNYFLQQRFNPNDPKEVEWWLTRFKELDLRLAHWKMLLPQKWKASTAPRQMTATAPATPRLDPNLTLAHVTHNASTILLHQLIAYPPQSWPFRKRLPSAWSAETCRSAGVEICTITQQYLRSSSSEMPITSQYAFCVYIAARMMLLHWRHAFDPGTELQGEFWLLVECLEEMARRWRGHSLASDSPSSSNHLHNSTQLPKDHQVLASKYALKLRELWSRCAQDGTFRIDVTDYTQEIDHRQAPVLQKDNLGGGLSYSPSGNLSNPGRQWVVSGQEAAGMLPFTGFGSTSPLNQHPLNKPSTPYGGMTGHPTPQDQLGFNDMSFGASMGINDYFMNLDRVIAFEDGSLFTTNLENGAW